MAMPSFNFRGNRPVVGLDLGEYALKAVEVQRAASGFEVVRAATIPIPPKMHDGEPGAFGEWIARALADSSIRASQCAWVAPGHQVFLRWLLLPAGTPDELARMVRFQAGKELPLPPEQMRFNYAPLGREAGKERVILGAVPLAFAQRREAIADAADLNAIGSVPSGYATWTVAVAGRTDGGGTAVIDVGWHSTEVLVGSEGSLRFSRSTPVGLAELAAAIGAGGAPGAAPEATPAVGPLEAVKQAAELPPAAAEWTRRFLAEVNRSLRAQQSEPGAVAVERIQVAGGGAVFPGLVRALADGTGLPAAPLDCFSDGLLTAPADLPQRDASLAAAAGAAIVSLRTDAPGLNLMGALLARRRLALSRLQRAALAAAALLVAAIVAGEVLLGQKEAALTARQNEVNKLKDRVDQITQIEKKIAATAPWGAGRVPLADLLLEVTSLFPPEAYVTSLTIEETGTIRINGRSKSDQVMSKLLNALNASKKLSNASLTSITQNGDKTEFRFDYAITVQTNTEETAGRPAPAGVAATTKN